MADFEKQVQYQAWFLSFSTLREPLHKLMNFPALITFMDLIKESYNANLRRKFIFIRIRVRVSFLESHYKINNYLSIK